LLNGSTLYYEYLATSKRFNSSTAYVTILSIDCTKYNKGYICLGSATTDNNLCIRVISDDSSVNITPARVLYLKPNLYDVIDISQCNTLNVQVYSNTNHTSFAGYYFYYIVVSG
jgi:hypothetical protein